MLHQFLYFVDACSRRVSPVYLSRLDRHLKLCHFLSQTAGQPKLRISAASHGCSFSGLMKRQRKMNLTGR